MMPPLTMWLHIESPGHRNVRLWLPLFLLWLLLLPLMLLVLVITAVIDLALIIVGERYHHYTLLLLGCLGLLADTRGMVVRVHAADRSIVNVVIN